MTRKPTPTAKGPMELHDRMLKVVTRAERIRALKLQLAAAKESVKEIKSQIEQEEVHRDQEIFDEPEGELGFQDGPTPGEVVKKAARTLRKLGATVTVGDGKSAAAGEDYEDADGNRS